MELLDPSLCSLISTVYFCVFKDSPVSSSPHTPFSSISPPLTSPDPPTGYAAPRKLKKLPYYLNLCLQVVLAWVTSVRDLWRDLAQSCFSPETVSLSYFIVSQAFVCFPGYHVLAKVHGRSWPVGRICCVAIILGSLCEAV